MLSITARQLQLRAQPVVAAAQNGDKIAWPVSSSPTQKRMAIELTFDDALVTAGQTTSPRSRFDRTFTLPMPADCRPSRRNRLATTAQR